MNAQVIEKRKKNAAKEYSVKQSFIGRNTSLYYLVCGIYLVAAMWSITTAGGNIYIRLETAMGDGIIPLMLAGLLAVTIVTLQYVTGKGTVDDLQVNAYKGTVAERAMLYLKGVAFILVTIFSIILSVNGAQIANHWYRSTINTPTLIDENLALQNIDNRIIAAEKRIQEYSGIKWKGTTTVDARRMIVTEQKNIDRLQNLRGAEVIRIRDINHAKQAQHAIETSANGNFLAHLAGVGELVCLFCIIFIGIYDDGIYREAGAKGKKVVPIKIHREVEDLPYEEVQDRIHVSGFASNTNPNVMAKLQNKRRVQLHRIRKAGENATARQLQGLINTERQIKRYKEMM